MRTFRRLIALTTALAVGCASYTQSKIDLTTQTQRGVATVREAVNARRLHDEAAADALRQRLDDAFDADIAARGTAALDAEWVIAHRKAYAAAIDAFAAQQRSFTESDGATLATLDAVSMALAQLQQMHAAELRLTLPEVKR